MTASPPLSWPPADPPPAPPRATNDAYTLRDIVANAFFHRKAILIAFLIPLILAMAAATQAPRRYTAETRLMVLFSREQSGAQDLLGAPSIISVDGMRATQTEVQLLKSSEVIQGMIDDVGSERLFPELGRRRLLGLLPPLEEEERTEKAVELVLRHLRVDAASDSNIVQVSYSHPDRAVALEAVSALVDIYLDHRHGVFENKRSTFLLAEAARFLRQLRNAEAAIEQVKKDYDIVDIDQETLLAVNQVDSLVQRTRHLLERQAGVRSEVANARATLDALPTMVSSFSEWTNQTQNDLARNQRIELETQRELLIDRYQDTHPRIAEIDKELDAIERFQKQHQPRYQTERTIRNPAVEFITNHLLTLQIEEEAVGHQLAELHDLKETAEARAAQVREASQRLRDLERERTIAESSYREYSARAEAARIEEHSARVRNANVRVVEAAFAPPSGHSLAPSILAGGLFAGLVLATLSGLIAARGRQVILAPTEAKRRLLLPPLATFDHDGDGGGRGNGEEMIFLVNRLFDTDASGERLKMLQVVSPTGQEGQHEVLRDLARETAAGFGLRTLIIDLDGRNSGHREALGADQAGVPVVPPGDGKPALPGILPTRHANLFLTADTAASQLGDQRIERVQAQKLLKAVGEAFDVILIDAPLLRTNRMALRFAPLVDGTIILVRAEETRLPAALNLKDTILEAGGDLLGVIVTGRRFHIPRGILRWL